MSACCPSHSARSGHGCTSTSSPSAPAAADKPHETSNAQAAADAGLPMALSAYPHPNQDNGRGMHWVPTTSQPRDVVDRFVAEAQRLVPGATRALAAGDLATFGTLVDESQHLAEQWLGNQIPETSALARLARRLGADGASAFGAGFGGSVWALVEGDGDAFARRWDEAAFVARPGPPVTSLL